MKNLVILFMCSFLCGCGCVLSQIPPQYIYAGENCEAGLPDYRLIITALDNCKITDFTQDPIPGFILSATNMITNVKVRAVDNSGNASEVNFSVALLDTIAPILNYDALTAMTDKQLIELYRTWEAAVKINGIAKWIYDQRWTGGMAFADTANIMNQLKTFTMAITLTDQEYLEWKNYMNSH